MQLMIVVDEGTSQPFIIPKERVLQVIPILDISQRRRIRQQKYDR